MNKEQRLRISQFKKLKKVVGKPVKVEYVEGGRTEIDAGVLRKVKNSGVEVGQMDYSGKEHWPTHLPWTGGRGGVKKIYDSRGKILYDNSHIVGDHYGGSKAENSAENFYRTFEKGVDEPGYEGLLQQMRASRKESGILAFLSVGAIIAGIVFLSPNLTGNAISNLSSSSSNILGGILFLLGVVGAFFYTKK